MLSPSLIVALYAKLLRVEQDRHRAIIDQRHIHMCAESALLHLKSLRAQRLVEFEPDPFGMLGFAGAHEARTIAFSGVREQCELRDRQNRAADVVDRQIHLALFVFEHAQIRDFVGEPVDLPGAVGIAHADEQHIAGCDGLFGECRVEFADCLVGHGHAGVAHFLQYDSHTGTIARRGVRKPESQQSADSGSLSEKRHAHLPISAR